MLETQKKRRSVWALTAFEQSSHTNSHRLFNDIGPITSTAFNNSSDRRNLGQ